MQGDEVFCQRARGGLGDGGHNVRSAEARRALFSIHIKQWSRLGSLSQSVVAAPDRCRGAARATHDLRSRTARPRHPTATIRPGRSPAPHAGRTTRRRATTGGSAPASSASPENVQLTRSTGPASGLTQRAPQDGLTACKEPLCQRTGRSDDPCGLQLASQNTVQLFDILMKPVNDQTLEIRGHFDLALDQDHDLVQRQPR